MGGQEEWGEGVQVFFLYTGRACFKSTLNYSHRYHESTPFFLKEIKLKLSLKKVVGLIPSKGRINIKQMVKT